MDAFEVWASGSRCVLLSLATRGAQFYERIRYVSKAEYFKKYLGPANPQPVLT